MKFKRADPIGCYLNLELIIIEKWWGLDPLGMDHS